MEQRRTETARRRRIAIACLVTTLTLGAAACKSSSSASSQTGGGTATTPATVSAFAKYPAPSGGNGGSTDVGVTATSINVGSPIAASGPLPGAQLGTYLGAKAYYAWVNASGGIYGRQLNLTHIETGFDANVGLSECTKYIPTMFAMNATQSNVDAACYPLVQKSGIPWIGGWFDPQYYALPNALSPFSETPYGQEPTTSYQLYKQANPSISKVAILWVNTAGIASFVKSDVAGWTSVGVKTVYDYGVGPDVANLTPYIIQARQSGADILDAFAVDVTEASRIAQAMAQQNWQPTLKINYAIYDASWHKLAGPGAPGWETTTTYNTLPFLDPAAMETTPGGKEFEYWWNKVNPNQPIDTFSIEGWVAAAYFVQGLIDAGPKLTRADLLAAVKNIKNFSAGGVMPSHNPGKSAVMCGLVMQSTASGYVQAYPKSGFTCTGTIVTYPTS
jgi:ABC-type branched-subunit amino acid transport system substrate-binding protein